jgi:hypothetical protein
VRAGSLRFVLLKALGEAAVAGDVLEADVVAVWREIGCA